MADSINVRTLAALKLFFAAMFFPAKIGSTG